STPAKSKSSPEARQIPDQKVAKAEASAPSTTEKPTGDATNAVRGSIDAVPPGMMTRMAMMEGGFGGGDAGAAEADADFRRRLEITQLAAALPTWEKNSKNDVILKKLETPIPMNFANETPLDDVLKYIKTSLGKHDHPIPIYVDPIGLQQ